MKAAPLQALGIKRQAEPVMPEHLDQIAAAAAEDVKIARMRIASEGLLHLQRQPVHAPAHVGGAGGDPDPHT